MTAPAPRGRALAALEVPDFRLFFAGAIVSNSGNWLQAVAQAAVVQEITGNAALVGTSALASTLPMMFSSLVGGTIADRIPRRTILLRTQLILMVFAAGFGLLWVGGVRTVWPFLVLGAFSGLVGGFHFPAWQAFVSELVPRELLMNAVTLNSTQFNAARLFGPALAGLLLWAGGPALCFFVNASTFLAALFAVWRIRPPSAESLARQAEQRRSSRPLADLVAAMRTLPEYPGVRRVLIVAMFTSSMGAPISYLAVVFARDVFEVSDLAYGFLVSAMGVGAVLAAPLFASRGPNVRRSRLVSRSLVFYGVGILTVALAPAYWVGLVGMAIVGGCHLVTASTLNTSVQLQVPELLRAKMLSFYLTVLMGGLPLGSQLQGAIAELVSPRVAVGGAGTVLVLAGAWFWLSGSLSSIDGDLEHRPG